jgi:curli biogenesis system outer membrane secretion channel CsgG
MYKSIILCLTFIVACVVTSLAQDFDNIISATADTIAKKIISSQRKTVAITDFINLDESITQLGTFLSEEVSSELSNLTDNQTKFRILERSKLDQIFKEKNLIQSTDGSKMAKELGKLDVANILIFATITDFNGYYRVVMKLLDTKTGDALSSFKVNFVKTPSLEALNMKVVKTSTQITNQTSNKSIVSTTSVTKENKPELGDYCFTNKASFSSYDVKIDIFNKGENDPIKTINVTFGEKSCVYELPKGVYRLELTWTDAFKNEIKKQTKEIRVKSGKSESIDLYD